ncbi:MAG: hypothetical protein EBT39_00835 [Sphingobacteriia bacterium]|nr:hypothetical protein [Candidatus Fonsibacter lacus]
MILRLTFSRTQIYGKNLSVWQNVVGCRWAKLNVLQKCWVLFRLAAFFILLNFNLIILSFKLAQE